MKRVSRNVPVLLCGLIILSAETVLASENAVVNGSFEQVVASDGKWTGNKAEAWNDVWVPTGEPIITVDDTQAYDGEKSLYIDAVDTARVAVSQDITVDPSSTYDLSAFIKTDNVVSSQGVRLRILYYANGVQKSLEYSDRYTGTNNWTEIHQKITTGTDIDSIRIQLFFESGTGKAWFDAVSLEKIPVVEMLKLEQEDIQLTLGESKTLEVQVEPADFAVESLNWQSTNNGVVNVQNGVITGIGEGSATISVTSPDGSLSDTVSVVVTVDSSMGTTLPNFSDTVQMVQGQVLLPFETTLPSGFTTVSSDEEVLVVKNGLLQAIKPGNATVSILDAERKAAGAIAVEVTAAEWTDFDTLRMRWENLISGEEYYDADDSNMSAMQIKKDAAAQELWDTMYKSNDRIYLWDSEASGTSATITSSYRKIYKLAEAAVTPASTLFHNEALIRDVLSAMEWLYANKYNETKTITGNWWDYEIGTPRAINDILTVFHPIVTKEQIMKYTEPITTFVPDVNSIMATLGSKKLEATGANQIDISKVKLIQGILREDSQAILDAKGALSKVFKNVESGEGFYADGSFIQHTNIPYTGSYGNVLIDGLSQLLTVVQNTDYQIDDPNLTNVYSWIDNSFSPVLYKGSLMDMVRGRAISRQNLQDHAASMEVIRAVIRFSEFAPEEIAMSFRELAKGWLISDTYFDYIANVGNYRDIALASELLADETIFGAEQSQLFKNFANMDRVVYRNPKKDFAFGISMHSTRTQNYEDMNNENRQGWFTGDGMTYLYNGDLGQFSGDYWATINPYRLPGTTVLTSPRLDGSGETVSTKTFVGASVIDNRMGTVAMDFENWTRDLSARKSWFIFGDKIVALGADIQNSSGVNAETIIENRKLIAEESYTVLSDGEQLDTTKGQTGVVSNPNWLLLQAPEATQSIGYVFPDNQEVHYLLENRSGSWKNINYTQSAAVVSNDFFTMWLDHGGNSNGDTYSYILYPNATQEELVKAAEADSVSIIQNDGVVQAVYDAETGATGINLWEDIPTKIGAVTLFQAASFTMEETEETIKIAVSDPSMLNTTGINLRLDGKKLQVLKKPENVVVKTTGNRLEIKIDPSGAAGKSTELIISKGKKNKAEKSEKTLNNNESNNANK